MNGKVSKAFSTHTRHRMIGHNSTTNWANGQWRSGLGVPNQNVFIPQLQTY